MEKFSTKHNWGKTFASILCIVLFSVTSLFSQTTVFVEDFNTWSPGPTLGTWTFESYDPATGAAISAPLGAWNYNGIAYDPPFSAYHDWWAGNSAGGYPAYNDWMISPEIDLSAASSNIYLEWWNFTLYTASYAHYHDVLISTVDPATGSANWTSVFVQFDQALANDAVWEYESVDISAFAGGSIWVACNYQGQDASEWYVDFMSVMDYGATVLGCTDSTAANFDPNANQDDGSCYFAGLDCNAAVQAFDGVNTASGQPYWYVYTVTADGQLNVSSIGSGVDTYLGLFSNCAVSNGFASSGDLGSNDDYGSFLFGEYESDLTISVFTGMNIYIFWEDAYGTSGFDFTITFTAGTGGCTDSTALNYNPAATYDDGSCVPYVYGCTDFTAMNFDPLANTDDGSCMFCTAPDNQISISMTTDLFASEASWVITDSQGNVVVTSSVYATQGTYDEGSFCLADDCYTLNMFDSFGDGWCWAGSCGAVTISDASGNVILSAGCASGQASATADFALGSASCGIPGCTDSTAANFDPAATVDDGSCSYCTDTQMYITCGGGSWQGEVSWSITDSQGAIVASGGAPFSGDICVPDDCFQVQMNDSFGDGWNGNYLDITDINGNVIGSYTLASGLSGSDQFATGSIVCPVYGCTDPAAVNFDASANTDDGSCTYSCTAAPVCENFDSTGTGFFNQSTADGFDWVQGTTTPSFQTGPQAGDVTGGSFMFTESSGNYYNTAVLVSNCVDISGLTNPAFNFYYNMYGLSMGDLLVEVVEPNGTATQVFYVFGEQGFDWNFASVDLSAWAGSSNISVQISSTTGGSFTSDCAIDALCFGELVVTGCTDATACNYDANASVDDGSCEFISCCTDNVIAVNMYDAWGDGWNQGSYTIMDTLGNTLGSGTISAGSVGTDSICIPDGCSYIMTVGVDSNGATAGLFAGEMAFDVTDASGTVLLSAGGAASGGGAGIYNLALGAACQIWGCTDATATNYNSLATDDDGSCCFDNYVSVTIQLGYFANEASWDITDSQGNVMISGGGYTTGLAPAGDSYLNTTFGPFCWPDDCYIINQYDAFGDGWFAGIAGDIRIVNAVDGSTLTLTPAFSAGTQQTTVANGMGCAPGCTDSTALNYDPSANYDDGSCAYPCQDNVFTLNMADSFGDGWNGNTFDIFDSAGILVASATLTTGASGSEDFCLPDDCYSYTVGGGSWQSEVSWALLDASGNVAAFGIAPQTGSFAAGSGFCAVFGCTDSTAINFDPLANTDDGSCAFACAAPYYEDFDAGFGSWTQGLTTTFGGTDVADWSIGATTPSTGTGPQNGDVTGGNFVFMEATPLWSQFAGTGQMTLTSECIDISALACPELTFWYNMTENPSFLGYMGALAVTINGTAVWSYGPGLNTSSCADGWCLAVVDLSAFANETSASISFIGTVGLNGYADIAFDAVGVAECQAFGCTDAAACNFDSTASADDGSCDYSCIGCTDSTAANWGGSGVTVDDGSCIYCTDNWVNIDCDGGLWQAEVSWTLMNDLGDTVATGGAPYNADFCLPDGCYTLDMVDSFGDGWNGNTFTINGAWGATLGSGLTGSDQYYLGTSGFCPVLGCTDSTAVNFDASANTDDGSCQYACTAAPYSENFDLGLGTWTQDATDGFDWLLDAAGTPSSATGPSDDVTGGGSYLFTESSGNYLNNAGFTSECFDISALTNPCFSFMYHMYGAAMGTLEVYVNGTLEWSLSGDQGNAWSYAQVSLAAYAGTDVTIQFVGTTGTSFTSDMAIDEVSIDECAVPGCTDATACNFDSTATVDDGSCEFMSCCTDNVVTVSCGGGSWQAEVSWTMTNSSGVVVASGGAPFAGDFCLPDDCYVIDMADSFGDGWNGNILDVAGSTFTLASGLTGQDQVAVGNGFCAVYGCTDSTATNFDPAANTDDGSCQYSCTAAPYSENFDAGLGTWTQDATDGFDWTLNAFGTPSFNTGPSDDVTGGGNYLFTESSGNYLNTAGITSECFDISALTNPCFSFMYHMFGTAQGYLEVYVNGNLEWSLNGDQGDVWTYAQVSLAAYAGTDVTIQIVGTTGTSFSSDMAIDEVGINECAATGCTDSTACNFDPSASTDDGSCDFSCYGCTDATASNYDATATLDDGSCCFDNYLTLSMNDSWGDGWNGNTFTITDANGVVIATATLAAGSAGTETFCIPDGCAYSFTCGGGSFASEVSWVLSDATGTLASGGAPASGTFDLNCAGPIAGCTDPNAFNYDPNATVDDGSCCIGTQLTIYMMDAFGDGWNGNVGTLVNLTTGDTVLSATLAIGAMDSLTVCADPALLATSCFDMTVGGGSWQSEVSWYIVDQSTGLTILAGGAPFAYQFGNCPVFGCTDPNAINYDSTATVDDGSCCVGTFLTFNMYDSFGDGWNGATGTLVNVTTGDTLFSGVTMGCSYPGCVSDAFTVCADPAQLATGCFEMTVGGGSYDSEISWDVVDNSTGLTILMGGAPFFYQFGNCPTPGCTDVNAANYDSTATVDDGSCYYTGCTDANADNYDSTATVDDGSCTYCSTLSGVIDYAIDASGAGACDGMGSVSATGGTSPYNISWPSDPNTLCAGTYTVTITDAAGCVTTVDVTITEAVTVVSGCTDPTATNYDSTATVDDGSCIFPSVCADATNLNTTNVVHSRATFNWDNTGAEYYRIRVNTGSGWSILTQIGAADGFAHPNASKTRYFLTPNTTYEWQVRGWCLDGSVSSWSASATFSTLEECPNATNLGSTGVEGEWATMTWDAPAATHGVDYYLARVREVGSSSWNIKGNIGNGLSKTIGSLAQGATYEFETRTWCNTGDANNPSDPYYKSDWGGNGQFTTVPCPVQTDNLAVTQLTATSADFSWTLISATPAADHFTIRFREVGATTWNYRSVAGGGTATGRTIGGFTSGVDYEWEVRTFCGVGSTWKSPWFAGPDFNLGSGARVNTPFSQLEVFPNPSRDIFNVSFVSDEIQNVTIKVVNMIGEEVHANELVEFVGQYTNKIDLSTQPKGVYFLEITSDNGGINKKVVLQ